MCAMHEGGKHKAFGPNAAVMHYIRLLHGITIIHKEYRSLVPTQCLHWFASHRGNPHHPQGIHILGPIFGLSLKSNFKNFMSINQRQYCK